MTAADMPTALYDIREQCMPELIRTFDILKADECRRMPDGLIQSLASAGMFGLMGPKSNGGLGLTLSSAVDHVRQIAAFDISAAAAMVIHNFLAAPLIANSMAFKESDGITNAMYTGAALCAFALTEAGAGSSPRHISTNVSISEDGYSLFGRKIWIGLADWATWLVVFARYSSGHKAGQIGCFLVNRNSPGVEIFREHLTLGIRGIVQNTVIFDCVKIPFEYALSEGGGWRSATASMDLGRIGVGAIALGAAERATQIAILYAKERNIGRLKLIDINYVNNCLLQMTTKIKLISDMMSCICDPRLDRSFITYFAPSFKIVATEWAGDIIDRCVQILGGRGYEEDIGLARIFRDARILRIFEGPTETLLSFLGRCATSTATQNDMLLFIERIGGSTVGISHTDSLLSDGWSVVREIVRGICIKNSYSEDEFNYLMTDIDSRIVNSRSTSREISYYANTTIDQFMAKLQNDILTPDVDFTNMRMAGYL